MNFYLKNILRLLCPFVLIIMLSAPVVLAQRINFASLALDGTTPIIVMDSLNIELKQLTGGKVFLKLYTGATMGGEKDILAKMRRGRIHAAGFTGYGLGVILPEMRIMEVPFLFRNADEIDYVIDKLYDRFAKAFEREGYVLLGWAEAGFVHFFSNKKITNINDLKGIRMWTWQGDKLALAMFKSLNLTPKPLPITDVVTSLQTGLIDAVYAPPYHAAGLGWAQRTRFMSKLPITNAAGAIVMLKKKFDELSPDNQQILLRSSKKWLRRLVELTRIDNKNTIQRFEKAGIELIPAPAGQELQVFFDTGVKVRNELAGDLYPRELLDKVLAYLEEYRSSHK